MQMYHKKVIKNEDPTRKGIVSYFRTQLEHTCKQRISNVIRNSFVRNLENVVVTYYKVSHNDKPRNNGCIK